MIKQQNCIQTAPRFYLRAFLCIIIPTIVSRCLSVAQLCCSGSACASEVGVMLLRWGSIAFLCLSIAAAYTLIAAAIYALGSKGAACIMFFYALRCFFDSAAKFFTENLYSGQAVAERSDYDSILSVVTLLSEFFASVALAFGVWIMTSAFCRMYRARDCSRKYTLKSAVNAAILLQFAVPFLRMLVRFFSGFIRENRTPSLSMLRSLVRDGLEIVVFYAIIAFIGSRIVLAICTRREF